MSATYRNLGQVAPLATAETDLYTVPSPVAAICSSLVVCNRGTGATTFRVSVSISGAVTATKDYLYYDVPIAGNDTFIATIGVTLSANDVMRVYAGNANLSFSLWGTQIV
jgi:hypothetical protein